MKLVPLSEVRHALNVMDWHYRIYIKFFTKYEKQNHVPTFNITTNVMRIAHVIESENNARIKMLIFTRISNKCYKSRPESAIKIVGLGETIFLKYSFKGKYL